jgi:hypothetical protein
MSRIDQRNMRKRLGEITYQSLRPRIVFFGQKPDIIPQCKQPFEQLVCFRGPPRYQQAVCQPKTAREECTLAGGQAIAGVRGVIASDKTVR